MDAAELIREARHLLFERGWTKFELEDENGHLCAIGALQSTVETCNCDAYRTALHALNEASGLSCGRGGENCEHPIARFNDHPHRTFQEVIDVFDKAEKIAESALPLNPTPASRPSRRWCSSVCSGCEPSSG